MSISLRQHELIFLLSSPDPLLNKRGLQRICDAIEAGAPVDLKRDPALIALIAKLKSSSDQKVRLWLYKLIGLTGLVNLAPWLKARLERGESHPENLTWAYGSLSALVGLVPARRALENSGQDPLDPAFSISSDYFRHRLPIDPAILRAALGNDDPLAHQWVSMRHGQMPDAVPLGAIHDLSTSAENIVVEYSLWAAHRDNKASIGNVSLDPQMFPYYPANIRRWYLRLLLKSPQNIPVYWDILEAAFEDSSNMVREALALGLSGTKIPRLVVPKLADWYLSEPDQLVQISLRQLVVANRRFGELRGLAQVAAESIAFDYGIAVEKRNQSARILVPSRQRPHKETRLDTVPFIVSDTQEQVYLLGVDTVEFSKRSDRQQYRIFRDLLDGLQHQEEVVRQEPADICVVPTGDGFFVCFRSARNRVAPVKLALALRHDFQSLRSYELRFGVNAGPATWILMRSGQTQVISHAVNWTARVMTAAQPGQVLLSDTYYQTFVIPSRDELLGVTFSPISGHQTKHGEDLAVWDATYASPHQDRDTSR